MISTGVMGLGIGLLLGLLIGAYGTLYIMKKVDSEDETHYR